MSDSLNGVNVNQLVGTINAVKEQPSMADFKFSATKNIEAYKYLQESINEFPDQAVLTSKINKIGFENTSVTNLFNGIVSIHKSFKVF